MTKSNFITKIIETYNNGLLYTNLNKDFKALTLLKEKEDKQFTEAINDLQDEINVFESVPELDSWLIDNGAIHIDNIAYKNKRYFEDVPYSIYLNEMIQRDSYEVLKLKKQVSKSTSNLTRAKSIGDKVSRVLTWTDDKNLIKSGDYYVMPNEAIAYKKVDCEDHAFVNASIDVEIGVVYGFLTINNNKFGHAWNCFVYNDKLYFLETTGNTGKTILAKNANNYDARFIVTKDNTYQIGIPINFGLIAEKL